MHKRARSLSCGLTSDIGSKRIAALEVPTLNVSDSSLPNNNSAKYHKRIVSFSQEIISRSYHEDSPPSRKRKSLGNVTALKKIFAEEKLSFKRLSGESFHKKPRKPILKKTAVDIHASFEAEEISDSAYGSADLSSHDQTVAMIAPTGETRAFAAKKNVYSTKLVQKVATKDSTDETIERLARQLSELVYHGD